MDITPWMVWFLGCLGRAIEGAQDVLRTVLFKARFWQSVRDFRLNERERLVLNRLLDGFEGKLTTSKWAKLAKCSHDTALRDIAALVQGGAGAGIDQAREHFQRGGLAGAVGPEKPTISPGSMLKLT